MWPRSEWGARFLTRSEWSACFLTWDLPRAIQFPVHPDCSYEGVLCYTNPGLKPVRLDEVVSERFVVGRVFVQ